MEPGGKDLSGYVDGKRVDDEMGVLASCIYENRLVYMVKNRIECN